MDDSLDEEVTEELSTVEFCVNSSNLTDTSKVCIMILSTVEFRVNSSNLTDTSKVCIMILSTVEFCVNSSILLTL